MASLADIYGAPSYSTADHQPGRIIGPAPSDIAFAQGPITGPTRPQDIAFAVTPEHLRRAALVREIMARRAAQRPHYNVEVGQPQMPPQYRVDVGDPVIADQVIARRGR